MIRIVGTEQIGDLLDRRRARFYEAEAVVRPIIDDVERRGDEALREYAARFDNHHGKNFCASLDELTGAAGRLTPQFKSAVEQASGNIRKFAEFQLPRQQMMETAPGIRVGQLVRPLGTVAAYVPSGRYPLPSTLMMTAIPAQVAGVCQICVTSPRAVDAVDGTAHLLGLTRVFRLGGAHAIAGFAFGTGTVPKADRIVGPGNIYVAAAKKLLAGHVGIDFIAGPTEILIIADEGDPRYLAADMLAQSEHDVEASAVLLTTRESLARKVAAEIDTQLATLPTREVATASITKNSVIAVLSSTAECVALANMFAPEHLSIYDSSVLSQIDNAGGIFIGPFSPEAAGDYATGPSHVLPTGGYSRLRGGLSSADFVKVISVQELSQSGLRSVASSVTNLAREEGLEGHARSVEMRL